MQPVSRTASTESVRTPSPVFSLAVSWARTARAPAPIRTPWRRLPVTRTRVQVSSAPSSAVTPSSAEPDTSQSRNVAVPTRPSSTPEPPAPRTTVEPSRMSAPSAIRTPARPASRTSQFSSCPRPSRSAATPSPFARWTATRRSLGLAPSVISTPVPVTSRTSIRSTSAALPPVSSTPSAQSRTTVRASEGPEESPTQRPVPSPPSISQSSKVPRERAVTWTPWPVVREARQRRSSGSVPPASTKPWPDVPVTVQSSRETRAVELM